MRAHDCHACRITNVQWSVESIRCAIVDGKQTSFVFIELFIRLQKEKEKKKELVVHRHEKIDPVDDLY